MATNLNSFKDRKTDPFLIQDNSGQNFKVRRDRTDDWLEESILGPTSNPNSKRKEFLGVSVTSRRLIWLGVLISFGFLTLFVKAAYLQTIKGNYYRGVAEGNRIRIRAITADRGLIFDRNQTPLVENIPSYSLYLVPGDLPREESSREKIIKQIADLVSEDVQKINELIASYPYFYYQPIPIKDGLDYNQAVLLKIASADLPGLILEIGSRRHYLNQDQNGETIPSFAHLIGYVGRINKQELERSPNRYQPNDYLGKAGVELSWEDVLRGEDGKKQIEVDVLGKEKKIIAQKDPRPGKNLVLSLDLKLQEKVESIFKENLKKFNKKRGSVIILDPNNGEILSLVSWPGFDNNVFINGLDGTTFQNLINDPNQPLFNRSISGEYPSGSTIKPVFAAAALEEGIINQNTTFNSTGGINHDQWFFPDWKKGGHGLTNVIRALAESINTFFYIIGGGYKDFVGLGIDRLVQYTRLFGFGQKLGIDLPNESTGLIPTPEWKKESQGEEWYIGDTYHLAIGQGYIAVTPLQIAAATSFFANSGKIYRPHLVKEIIDSQTKETIKIDPTILRSNLISPTNINIVRRGLRQTVLTGSGKLLQAVPVPVAGKTGTAQWSSSKNPHAWFTGFAPYDQPKIVITVLVEEGGEGSTISTQIAQEILSWYFSQPASNLVDK